MKSYLIITATGPDRTGLVDEVTAFLSDREFNIESSRMAVLGGEFAIIMLVSGPADDISDLEQNPSALTAATGLQVFAKTTDPPDRRQVVPLVPYRLRGSGMDHPGIVHEISRTLHRMDINIEALETRVTPAPISGTPIFSMEATVAVPGSVKIRSLKRALEDIGEELNMELELELEET